ncbi:TonB-dependent receptor [Roseibacillus ishigakijimensis]|uniref:TonB-dependent receptor n=1 Tax=Roseibacillus ishigakijimensis TaxID=454146 RepID=A0A934RKE0_9BACT|nr:TonB-dependent receptor [Roseibacillus ishigakijimensis]MBK1832463.1 TonB-dependent receptor [Roseibacillus ishigakijimensis]
MIRLTGFSLSLLCWVGSGALLPGQVSLPPSTVAAVAEEEGLTDSLAFPGSGESFGREELQDSRSDSVLSFLSAQAGVPFLSVYGNSRSGSPVMRGFGDGSLRKTLILLDGLPLNRPDLSSPEWGRVPLESLESVSVLRGSRTVRYGSAALAGVIALQTEAGPVERGGELSAYLGSESTRSGALSLQAPLAEGAWTFRGEDYRSAGYRDHSGREEGSFSLSLQHSSGPAVESRLAFSASEVRFENPGGLGFDRFQSDPRQSAVYVTGFEDLYVTERRTSQLDGLLRWQGAGAWQGSARASGSWEERLINEGGFFADNEVGQGQGEMVGEWKGARLELEGGVRWRAERLQFRGYSDQERQLPRQRAELARESAALFLLGRYELGGGWSLRAGASGEGYQLRADSRGLGAFPSPEETFSEKGRELQWAAEAALEYEFAPESSAWLRYERVYRFPLLDEIAGYQGFLLDVPFNAALEPEWGHSVEAGFSAQWGLLQGGMALFGTWLEDEIAFQDNLNRNLAATARIGGELFAQWEGERWRADLRYHWTEARLREGEFADRELPLVPRHSLFGNLAFAPAADWEVSLGGQFLSSSWQGDDFGNEGQRLPARAVFHLGVDWQLSEDCLLYGKVTNLLDRHYASYAAATQFYPAPGRQWQCGLRLRF